MSHASAPTALHWRRSGLLLLAVLVVWAGLFWRDLAEIYSLWFTSDTYEHGTIILPVCTWLVWRQRAQLATLTAKTYWPAFILLLVLVALWLVGEFGQINVFRHAAVIAMVPVSLILLLGSSYFKRLWFVYGFSLFAIPFGEELVSSLQIITADIATYFVGLTGLPAHRQGLFISLPGMSFEVAKACSGIRYTISTLVVGLLYCHLSFKNYKNWLVAITLCVCIPIVSNGLRAFGIMMIGYGIDIKYATGVDHLIYGWMFFALTTLIIFVLLGRLSFKEVDESDNQTQRPAVVSYVSIWAWLATISPLIGLALFIHFKASTAATDANPINATQPMQARVLNFPDWQPEFEQADAIYRSRIRSFSCSQIDFYAAYYADHGRGKDVTTETNRIDLANFKTRTQAKDFQVMTTYTDKRLVQQYLASGQVINSRALFLITSAWIKFTQGVSPSFYVAALAKNSVSLEDQLVCTKQFKHQILGL